MTGLPHRTATTSCPCCIPTLGDSEGASRVAPVGGKGNIEMCLGQKKLESGFVSRGSGIIGDDKNNGE